MTVEKRPNPGNLRDIALHPYKVTCERTICIWVVAADSLDDGLEKLQKHRATNCPYKGGETKIGWEYIMGVSRTTLEKVWEDLLDIRYRHLVENKDKLEGEDMALLKGELRGIADVLALFMGPHFTTREDITREAMRRYEAETKGLTDYETPGIGALRFAPPPGENKYAAKAPSRPVSTSTPVAPAAPKAKASRFKPEEVKAIKAATEMGMMTRSELAKMYKVSEDVIQAAIES